MSRRQHRSCRTTALNPPDRWSSVHPTWMSMVQKSWYFTCNVTNKCDPLIQGVSNLDMPQHVQPQIVCFFGRCQCSTHVCCKTYTCLFTKCSALRVSWPGLQHFPTTNIVKTMWWNRGNLHRSFIDVVEMPGNAHLFSYCLSWFGRWITSYTYTCLCLYLKHKEHSRNPALQILNCPKQFLASWVFDDFIIDCFEKTRKRPRQCPWPASGFGTRGPTFFRRLWQFVAKVSYTAAKT